MTIREKVLAAAADARPFDGRELRRLRENAGLSQRTFGAIVGLSQSGVGALETTTGRRPTPATRAALNEAMDALRELDA